MRTKRPKLPAPRKQLALLWLLVPCLILLAAYMTDIYCFTPDQAQRLAEKRRMLDPTEVIWQGTAFWEDGPALNRFTANDRAVTFGEYTFTWWDGGWDVHMAITPREQGRPFTAGCFTDARFLEEQELPEEMSSLWEQYRASLTEEVFYVYGCLESSEVAELVIELEPSNFLLEPQLPQTVRLTAADWIMGSDGTAFFICPMEPILAAQSITGYVTAYDRDGRSLGTRCVTGMEHWVE